MHTYVQTYMHACIHTYVHTYIHTCMHACIHTYIHTYIHTVIKNYTTSSNKKKTETLITITAVMYIAEQGELRPVVRKEPQLQSLPFKV